MKHFSKPFALAAALALGWSASGALQAAGTAKPVLSGTVHEALFAVAFDGDKGIAVGAPGSILDTADGGATWKAVKSVPTRLALLGVAVKGEHALAVGQQGLVLRREGSEWKKADTGTDNRLFSVSVNAKGEAVAVGAFGSVLKSTDGGATWTSIAPMSWEAYAEPGVDPSIYAADVNEAGLITVAGEFGLILRSADGGATWTQLHKGDASLFAMHLGSNGVGYAVGQNGTVLRSADSGATWTALDAGTKAILLGVHASADRKIVITGMREMRVSADDGGSWSGVTGGNVNTLWYQGVSEPAGAGAALVVGQAGRILRIEN